MGERRDTLRRGVRELVDDHGDALDRLADSPNIGAGTRHVATPGFLRTGSTGRTEKCVICGKYLRASKTSRTGWRHSGARG